MAKTVRKYNTQNLTYGGRTLRVESKLSGLPVATDALVKVVQNFDRSIRTEVLNDAQVFLLKRARHYIQEGKKDALTPDPADNTHNLERDLDKYVKWEDTDRVIIDLSSIPYAALHNQPLGSSTLIGEGKRMLFYWYRKGRWVNTYAGVKKPGRAFLTRALKDTVREMPKLIKKYVQLYRQAGNLEISPTTGARLRGPTRSAVARRDARVG